MTEEQMGGTTPETEAAASVADRAPEQAAGHRLALPYAAPGLIPITGPAIPKAARRRLILAGDVPSPTSPPRPLPQQRSSPTTVTKTTCR